MSFLDAARAAALVGSTVRLATLVELQFASRTMHLWNGTASIDLYGVEWSGVGKYAAIEGLQQSRDATSSKVTFKLDGVSEEVLAAARRNTADIDGRYAYVWLQLLDAEWQALGARIPILVGRMQRIAVDRDAASELSGGGRSVSLDVENVFANRSKPSAGRYTDADQQARHPGDKFCRFAAAQLRRRIVWPNY